MLLFPLWHTFNACAPLGFIGFPEDGGSMSVRRALSILECLQARAPAHRVKDIEDNEAD